MPFTPESSVLGLRTTAAFEEDAADEPPERVLYMAPTPVDRDRGAAELRPAALLLAAEAFDASAMSMRFESCRFEGCNASEGGALLATGGVVSARNTAFVRNQAVGNGGAALISNCTAEFVAVWSVRHPDSKFR